MLVYVEQLKTNHLCSVPSHLQHKQYTFLIVWAVAKKQLMSSGSMSVLSNLMQTGLFWTIWIFRSTQKGRELFNGGISMGVSLSQSNKKWMHLGVHLQSTSSINNLELNIVSSYCGLKADMIYAKQQSSCNAECQIPKLTRMWPFMLIPGYSLC